MQENILPFRKPAVAEHDPAFERAAFFAELEVEELTKLIPQAAPAQARFVY